MIFRASREVPNVSAKHKAREAHFYAPTKHDRNMQTAVGVALALSVVFGLYVMAFGAYVIFSRILEWIGV